ncbi:MAG: hypothetical protein H7287_03475 [Thermoleophilia bacterium]|nr:hypothetical protein [Thermoleophilia bacterium]
MRIDPSQLSEPLAHILGAGAVDAAQGQKAATAATGDTGLDTLDQMLLKRLRANTTADAANSVVNFHDAYDRLYALKDLAAADPAQAQQAQGTLEGQRVRGLLGD